MVMTRLEGAYSCIEIGERKEAQGDLRRAHMAYETAIRDFMHLAFVECSTADDVRSWISDHPLELAAERFLEITDKVIQMPQAEWPRHFPSGNYLPIAFSHFFAVLGQHERSRFLARVASEPILFANDFWGEFGKMYGALVAGRTYDPQFGKLNFLERYEMPYANLMLAVMHGEPLEAPFAEIDRQFSARNADGRMNDADAYMIEGSPEFPVRFDFRKAGLQATIANTRLRAIN